MTSDPVQGGGHLEARRDFLDADEREGRLTFAELPGFLFALVCVPETVAPSEWLPEVLGADPSFDDAGHVDRVVAGVMAWYNEINAGVLERQPRLPDGYSFQDGILENFDPALRIAAWCRGVLPGPYLVG